MFIKKQFFIIKNSFENMDVKNENQESQKLLHSWPQYMRPTLVLV